jgi:hypothetical protein
MSQGVKCRQHLAGGLHYSVMLKSSQNPQQRPGVQQYEFHQELEEKKDWMVQQHLPFCQNSRLIRQLTGTYSPVSG